MCLTLQAAASGLWFPVIWELYMRVISALCSEGCVLKSADDKERVQTHQTLPHLCLIANAECIFALTISAYYSFEHEFTSLQGNFKQRRCNVMFGGIYSRKWSNMTEMFLLLACLQTKSAALSPGKCCGANVMVFSLLGKILLVKIKQVMWWPQEHMWF